MLVRAPSLPNFDGSHALGRVVVDLSHEGAPLARADGAAGCVVQVCVIDLRDFVIAAVAIRVRAVVVAYVVAQAAQIMLFERLGCNDVFGLKSWHALIPRLFTPSCFIRFLAPVGRFIFRMLLGFGGWSLVVHASGSRVGTRALNKRKLFGGLGFFRFNE